MDYLATFHTHAGAVKFDRMLRSLNEPCELSPTPRKLSSSCGVCARFKYDNYEELTGGDLDKIYSINGVQYTLVYDSESL